MTSTPSQRLAYAARFVSSEVRLIDGPLVEPTRDDLVRRMAHVAFETDSYWDRDDTRLALRIAGFSRFDIEACLDDVMQAATQIAVAEAMSQS